MMACESGCYVLVIRSQFERASAKARGAATTALRGLRRRKFDRKLEKGRIKA